MDTELVLTNLSNLIGVEHVLTQEKELAFFSADLFIEGMPPKAVIAPRTCDELVEAIKLCNTAGLAILPRGGGLSYTAGYVQSDPNLETVVIDTRRLNKIIDVSHDNMTITVQSGCTWEQISEASAMHGLRVTMPGPTTGRYSTIGGSISNNCMFFSSAKTGTSADAVLGLQIVTADGTIITTGSGAIKKGIAFFRNNGPDLTGLFLSDAGSLGVKITATLRLEPIPKGTAFRSIAFNTFEQMIPAIQAIGRSGLASECLATGPIADGAGPTLHITVEGCTQDIADSQLAALMSLIDSNGKEEDPIIPKFIREHGFGFVQTPLDPKGRMQIWTHGVFAIGQALEAYKALRAVLDRHQVAMEEHGVEATMSFACAGIAMMVEPVLCWTSTPTPLHCQGMAKANSSLSERSNSADDLTKRIRSDICVTLDSLGAAHMQYGRYYSYAEVTQNQTVTFLKEIKALVDPKRIINPGALGL